MLVTVSDVVTLSASIYRDYFNELMSYQKIHKLSDIDNIPTYRLSITSGVSGAGCVRLVAVGLMAVVAVTVN